MTEAAAASLADLQTERERLKAEQAREDYERALAETCRADEVYTAARAVRDIVARAATHLPQRLATEIEGERDEARIHYLLSDAIGDVLRDVGEAVAAGTEDSLPELGTAVRKGVQPRALLTVSQWADRYRWIESGTNLPGQWRTDHVPYLREIMDSLSEHSSVRKVTFMKASGVGGTEVLYNWLGYIMHQLQNKDAMLVVPTLELRNRSLNPRLRKMFGETTVLNDMVSGAQRSKANRDDLIEYGARARIIKAGANSPDSLRSDHLPYVIADEVDAFPWEVGQEGDPMTLIENRQRTFSRAKTYIVSTPTVEGGSRIDQDYRRSDRRLCHLPCPHCEHYHPLEWKHFQYKTESDPAAGEGDDETTPQVIDAWMVCPECGVKIEEGHKPWMLARWRWIPQRPKVKGHRGYHLNALYAPIALGLTWRDVAQKWLACQNDVSELKGFVNTYLGEVWREEGDSIDDLSLITRLEPYQPDDLPIVLITAGVDVQKDRLEATITAWGAGEEAWQLDHLIVPGETSVPDEGAWPVLEQALIDEGVEWACIDSGYNADAVYGFVKTRSWCWATKGMDGMNRPVIEDERRRRQRLRYRRKKGVPVEPIGVDNAKAIVYARLKMEHSGSGYIHFRESSAFDDEYFAQLGAEKLVKRTRRGRTAQEWVQQRARNEALDCLVLALAAARLSGVDLDAMAAEGRYIRGGRSQTAAVNRQQGGASKPASGSQHTGFGSEDWSL